jgi:hypothetical protein
LLILPFTLHSMMERDYRHASASPSCSFDVEPLRMARDAESKSLYLIVVLLAHRYA